MYILHEPSDTSFQKVGITGKIFPSTELSDKVGFVLIDTESGHETTIVEHESDFMYYVLEGSGLFEINNEKEACSAGDLVVIPAGSTFTYKGTLGCCLSIRRYGEKTKKKRFSLQVRILKCSKKQ